MEIFNKDYDMKNTINYLTEDQQLTIIKCNYDAIKWINNPSIEIQEVVINYDSSMIRNIINPSEYIQILAVKLDCFNISRIQKPSIEVQKLAISDNKNCYYRIENPCDEIKNFAISRGIFIDEIKNATYEMKKQSVMSIPNNIFFINNPSIELIDIAILNHEEFILKFINITPIEKRRRFNINAIIERYEYITKQDRLNRK